MSYRSSDVLRGDDAGDGNPGLAYAMQALYHRVTFP